MASKGLDFFEGWTTRKAIHPTFKKLISEPEYKYARNKLGKIQKRFQDPDGNFVEQFQTIGFDQRLFEIYLGEVFHACGYTIDRTHDRPDFLISKDSISMTVEAATASQSNKGIVPYEKTPAWGLDSTGVQSAQLNEWAIRLGSPLYTKYSAAYWKLPHVAGKPFVLAVQDMSRPGAMKASSATLLQYLYGVKFETQTDAEGSQQAIFKTLKEHSIAGKKIPSRYFDLRDARYISAVIFSNNGDLDTFNRMGYIEAGPDSKYIILRYGMCDSKKSGEIAPFIYRVGSQLAPHECWSTGLVVAHNPNALHPLPDGCFGEAVENRENPDGQIETRYTTAFRPFSSDTQIHDSKENINGHIYQSYTKHIVKLSRQFATPHIVCFL